MRQRPARVQVIRPVPQPLMRWDVLNEVLEMTRAKRFLEIGVQRGVCGARIKADVKWGVEPAPQPGAQKGYHQFFRCTSDAFFARLDTSARFDAVLIDGLHHAEQVLRDVVNALHHLAEDGVIVLHDCNPQTELAQRVPRQTGVWNGDCWKAMVVLRQLPDVDAFTIDADEGIGIVRPRTNRTPLTGVPERLCYNTLDQNRVELLDLVPAGLWGERAGAPFALGRVVVYSAIYGGRDRPITPPTAHDADEYVLFTDGAAAPGWSTISGPRARDPREKARQIKTIPPDRADGDVQVWIDGRIEPTGIRLRPLLRSVLRDAEIAAYRHPWRDCAYDEARECGELGLADTSALEAQCDRYREEGFPEHAGLFNTMVVARRNTPRMAELGKAWWHELERHTLRDQVSFPYLLWKHGVTCAELGQDVYRINSSEHFIRGRHGSEGPTT